MSHDTNPLQRFSRQRALVITGIVVGLAVAILAFNSIRTATVQEVTVLHSMPAPIIGIAINQDLMVISVLSGSAAAAADVQVGDTLVALADKPLTSLADVRAILQELKDYNQDIGSDAPQEQATLDAPTAAEHSTNSITNSLPKYTYDLTLQRGEDLLQKRITTAPIPTTPNQPTITPILEYEDTLFF